MKILGKWFLLLSLLWLPDSFAYNSYALWLASAHGELQAVQAELQAGANAATSCLTSGQTALMAASFGGHLEVVKELLKNGANFNAKDREGFTALMHAMFSGNRKIIEELIAVKALVNTRNKDGRTALSEAIFYNCSFEILLILLKAKADINDLPLKTRTKLLSRIKEKEQEKRQNS